MKYLLAILFFASSALAQSCYFMDPTGLTLTPAISAPHTYDDLTYVGGSKYIGINASAKTFYLIDATKSFVGDEVLRVITPELLAVESVKQDWGMTDDDIDYNAAAVITVERVKSGPSKTIYVRTRSIAPPGTTPNDQGARLGISSPVATLPGLLTAIEALAYAGHGKAFLYYANTTVPPSYYYRPVDLYQRPSGAAQENFETSDTLTQAAGIAARDMAYDGNLFWLLTTSRVYVYNDPALAYRIAVYGAPGGSNARSIAFNGANFLVCGV